MRFSFEKTESEAGDILFSTSGYHVLRSGIIAVKEGLRIDGIGAKTKWYFWPNAFIREFIGLMVNKKKTVIVSFVVISVFYALCKYVEFL
jgi:uncharacterized SAM-binding protein YcdF (DUF218 family)